MLISDTTVCWEKQEVCSQFYSQGHSWQHKENMIFQITPNLMDLHSSSYRMHKLLSDGAGLGES